MRILMVIWRRTENNAKVPLTTTSFVYFLPSPWVIETGSVLFDGRLTGSPEQLLGNVIKHKKRTGTHLNDFESLQLISCFCII